MKNPWKTIKKNVVYANKYGFILRDDDIINPKGNKGKYMVLEHPGYVFIVPLTSKLQVVLIKQWRYPIESESLELPTGAIDKKDEKKDPLETAKRELSEETGGSSKDWIFLGSHWLGNGFLRKRGYAFLALDTKLSQKPKPEETEQIEVHLMNFDKAIKEVVANNFQDYRTKLGLLLAKEYLDRRKIRY